MGNDPTITCLKDKALDHSCSTANLVRLAGIKPALAVRETAFLSLEDSLMAGIRRIELRLCRRQRQSLPLTDIPKLGDRGESRTRLYSLRRRARHPIRYTVENWWSPCESNAHSRVRSPVPCPVRRRDQTYGRRHRIRTCEMPGSEPGALSRLASRL